MKLIEKNTTFVIEVTHEELKALVHAADYDNDCPCRLWEALQEMEQNA